MVLSSPLVEPQRPAEGGRRRGFPGAGQVVEPGRIADLSVTGKAARAQDYLCQQAERYERYADEMADTLTAQDPVSFAWLKQTTPGPITA